MMDKFTWRMDELERKIGNESHNVGGPPNQVASTSATSSSSNVFRNEEQDVCIASRTEEKATQAQRPNMGQPHPNSRENVHEVEALSNNTNNQGPPVLTGEDVNMGGQPNANSQLHELYQAPLAIAGGDINMGGQAMDTGRPEDARWGKQRKLPLDEDEEDFGQDEDFGLDDDSDEAKNDDSDPDMVSITF